MSNETVNETNADAVEQDPAWHKGTPIENPEDGFRQRRVTRPPGWREAALANGEIREEGAPSPDEGRVYDEHAVVHRPPTATIESDGSD